MASILLARFEMKSIDQIRWRRKTSKDDLKLSKVWNSKLSAFKKIGGENLK